MRGYYIHTLASPSSFLNRSKHSLFSFLMMNTNSLTCIVIAYLNDVKCTLRMCIFGSPPVRRFAYSLHFHGVRPVGGAPSEWAHISHWTCLYHRRICPLATHDTYRALLCMSLWCYKKTTDKFYKPCKRVLCARSVDVLRISKPSLSATNPTILSMMSPYIKNMWFTYSSSRNSSFGREYMDWQHPDHSLWNPSWHLPHATYRDICR